uniref:Protein YIP n=2 Tax=Oryza TaxID=4527 RepID=A0A0E0NTN3_ORYRU
MAKEFPVPPVVFTPSTPTHRRHPPPGTGPSPPPAFAPPRPSTSSGANPLPFMSFDVGNAATSSSPPLFAGPIGVGGSGASFEDEPPLLEELGINTRQIWRKTLSILHPLRSADPSLHADADLSGPFLFLLSFGLFQLLAGKFHFGIVLGWVTVASLFLYFVFSMLSGGRRGDLDLYRCVSLVGYCMLPMVIFSAISLFLPRGGGLIFGVGMGFVLWSTRVCTRLLAELASSGDEHRGLIAYACWLVYMLFSLLVIMFRILLPYEVESCQSTSRWSGLGVFCWTTDYHASWEILCNDLFLFHPVVPVAW